MRVVCQKLGISAETLRAWERRYDIVNPTRNEAGHRLYSEQDLRTLSWLVDQIHQGFTIGQAVHLFKQKQEQPEKEERETVDANRQGIDQRNGYRETFCRFKQALVQWDEAAAHQVMDLACGMFGFEGFITEWIPEMQAYIQQESKEGGLRAANVDMALQVARNRLGSLLRFQPFAGSDPASPVKRIIAFPVEGEGSEIPLLTCSLFLRWKGASVQTFGQLPREEILYVLQEMQPQGVLGSMTKQNRVYRKGEFEERFIVWEEIVRDIRKQMPDREIWLLTDAYLFHQRTLKDLGVKVARNRREDWERILD